MDALKSIIFVPHWIAHALIRRGLPMSTVTKLDELAKVASPTDIAQMFCLNLPEVLRILGVEGENGWGDGSPSYALGEAWKLYNSEDVYRQTIMPLTAINETREAVVARLFTEGTLDERFDSPFKVYDLDRYFTAVVVHPGYFMASADNFLDIEEKNTRCLGLVRALLRALYVQAPYHLVARSPLYTRYLGLLSKKRILV